MFDSTMECIEIEILLTGNLSEDQLRAILPGDRALYIHSK
jgi:hypothetical protein